MLFVLGLADPATDQVGLTLAEEQLPKRVRARRRLAEMDREIDVHIDWVGATRPVGRLWARAKGVRQTCSFANDPAWLGLGGACPFDPNLPLVRGDAHWDGGLFNAFGDPAPDRWGRSLMGRRERALARAEGCAPRTLMEADVLMLVEDQTR